MLPRRPGLRGARLSAAASRMPPSRRRPPSGLRGARLSAVAVAVVVAACGGDDGRAAVDAVSGEAAEETVPYEAPAPGTSPSGAGAGEGFPEDSDESERLADYLPGFGFGSDPEQVQAFYERQERRVQDLIAQCMAGEGFEYIPAVRPAPDFAFGAVDEVEYARERGFGITTFVDEESVAFESGEEWTDPNRAIVDALSDSERQAYHDTLYAPPEPTGTETDPETGAVTEVYEGYGEGCQGRAYEEVYAADEFTELYEQLDLESMWERAEADPRMRDLSDEWSRCMGGRGYDYDDPDDLWESTYEDFEARLEEIMGPDRGFVDPFEGLSADEIEERVSTMSPEEMNDLYQEAQREARQNIDQAALSALQDEERALAVANAECSEGLRQGASEVMAEYEAELVEANRDLLESYRDRQRG